MSGTRAMTWQPGDPPPSDTDRRAVDAVSDGEVEARLAELERRLAER